MRLDNTPWFVRGVASDDIIRVEVDDEGVRWASDTVGRTAPSGRMSRYLFALAGTPG
ncbi:DUF4265 domain-containing protein [Streptomyces sp. NPDC012510]|uniref:DUF4265 domain-containing protein n=1 Tax=Streptomyces sp. NPDC012510 TaxID=3364838 RepID=UPI0036E906F3